MCGDHRRVISGRHLSKHGTDREEYMQEYGLSPDELIAKDFRIIQSSRRGYQPYGKREWIAAIKKVYQRDGNVFARRLQKKYLHLYTQGTWLFGDWDKALRAAGFVPDKMRLHKFWDREKVIKEIRSLRKRNEPLHARYAIRNYPGLFEAGRRLSSSAMVTTTTTRIFRPCSRRSKRVIFGREGQRIVTNQKDSRLGLPNRFRAAPFCIKNYRLTFTTRQLTGR
jgi:hypothetical protein